MAEKNLNSRIVHKHDIEVNWSKATNFIPKMGEIIVYDPDENHAAARVKIGDGVKTVIELAFIDDEAKAALFKEIDMVDEKVEALGQLVGDASIPEQIEEALLKTQADWNVNDENDPAYIKNRTHWEAEDGTIHQLDPKFIPTATNEEVYAMMLEEGALPIIQTEDGSVLTVAENEILMI